MPRDPCCPLCKSYRLAVHCRERTTPCGWLRCAECGAFGMADMTRWVAGTKPGRKPPT